MFGYQETLKYPIRLRKNNGNFSKHVELNNSTFNNSLGNAAEALLTPQL